MPIDHLSEFLDRLAESGDLIRVSADVNPHLELAEIARRAGCRNRALLFENVGGRSVPAVTGLFATEERTRLALGIESLNEIAERITALVTPDLPTGWIEALQLIPKFAEMSNWPVKQIDTALSQQVVHMGSDVNLETLPVPVCWPEESRPTITAGQIYVEETIGQSRSSADDSESERAEAQPPPGPSPFAAQQDGLAPESSPVTLIRHVSRVPVQIVDRNTVLVYWTPHGSEWHFARKCQGLNQQLPIAIALGGDPVLTLAASAPLPPFVDPLVFAGFIRQANVEVTAGRSVDVRVPANAEIVLEGMIDPARAFEEASTVATPTGHYDSPSQAVRVTVTALTHRANPVLPVMIPAGPPSESGWLDHASERILLPLVRLAVPELVDLRLPAAGAYRNFAFASIRKTWPQQARKVMNALWGIDRLSRVKMLVVVDEDVDIHNDDAVWHAVGANTHPGRDTIFSDGPADMLDHAAPVRGVGQRMGIDATAKSAEEGHPRAWPNALAVDSETEKLVSHRWFTYEIPEGKSHRSNGKSGS